MNNIQKNFKNKAKCGLRLAQGTGDLGFMQTIPDALPTSMFAPQQSANPNQGPALYGAGGGSSSPVSPTALSSGSTDLDTLGTPQGSAPQFSAAVDTMAEKAARAGLDPNAAYRPGGPGDPHASFSPGSSALRAGQASPQRQRRPTPDMITPYEPSRRMADGGILPTLRNRGAQIDAAVDSAVNPQAAPVAADPDAPDASGVRPSERAAARATMNAAAPKKSSFTLRGLGKALGMAEGGIVRGKGGPTDDAVPMTVGGVDVNLSNKEAVLPAKTVQALGGPSAVEDLIETTNGKPPVKHGLRAGGKYMTGATGGGIDPRMLTPAFRALEMTPVMEPAKNAGLEQIRSNTANAKMNALPNAYEPTPGRTTFTTNTAGVTRPVSAGQLVATGQHIPQTGTSLVATGQHIPQPPPAIEGASTRVPNKPGFYEQMGEQSKADLAKARANVPPAAKPGAIAKGMRAMPYLASAAYGYGAYSDAKKGDAGGAAGNAGMMAAPFAGPAGLGVMGADLVSNMATGKSLTDHIGTGVAYAHGKLFPNKSTLKPNYAELDKVALQNPGGKLQGLLGANTAQQYAEGTGKPVAAPFVDRQSAQDMVSDQPFDAAGAKTRNLYRSVSGTQGTDVLPDGLRAGPANSAAFNTPNNMAADTMGNFWQGKPGVQQQDGTGVASMRQKDGSYKNVALGKSEYTGADGKPTSNWADTQAFKDSEARNTRLAGLARSMERDRYGRDMGADIKDPRVIAAAQQNINRMDREDALASATENARMDRGLRQQQLGIQNKTADAQIRHADNAQQLLLAQRQAAAKAQGIENMQKIVAQAGYGGDEAKEYADFINLNHASDLAGMPHDKQLAMEPIMRAKFETMRNNNKYSTNGVRTIKNLEKTGESTLDYEKDAALDPTSIGVDKLLWFGDGEDGRGLGRANIFLRNNMPDWLKPSFGVETDAVDVFGGEGNVGGQRVMRKDVPGMRGPLLKTDMEYLRAKELQKNSR